MAEPGFEPGPSSVQASTITIRLPRRSQFLEAIQKKLCGDGNWGLGGENWRFSTNVVSLYLRNGTK